MKTENSQLASKYSERLEQAKKPPSITKFLTKFASVIWILCIISACSSMVSIIFGNFIALAGAPIFLIFGYIFKIFIPSAADAHHHRKITAEVSVIISSFLIETETDIYNSNSSLLSSNSSNSETIK